MFLNRRLFTELYRLAKWFLDNSATFSSPVTSCQLLSVGNCQTEIVFSVQSGFISRSVHARLRVCVQRLPFVMLLNKETYTYTQIDRQYFDQLILIAQLSTNAADLDDSSLTWNGEAAAGLHKYCWHSASSPSTVSMLDDEPTVHSSTIIRDCCIGRSVAKTVSTLAVGETDQVVTTSVSGLLC